MSYFEVRTRRQIRDHEIADMVNTIDGAVARGAGDDLFDLAEADSGALAEQQRALIAAAAESFPQTASFAGLVKHASPLIGDPLPALPATLTVLLGGTLGSSWTTANVLYSPDTGVRYSPLAGGLLLPSGESGAPSAEIQIQALTGGAITALPLGSVLQWETIPTGLNATATTTEDPDGGTDAETRDQYLKRFLDERANPDGGGRAVDFERWGRSVAGVGEATWLARRRGLGTGDLAVLDNELDPVSDDVLDDVQDKLDAMRPDCFKSCYAIRPTRTELDVTIELDMIPGYEFTVADESAVVSGSTATSIKVADASSWPSSGWAALRDLRQARKIVSVDYDTNVISVESPFLDSRGNDLAPSAGDLCLPGCAVYDALCRQIVAYFRDLKTGGTYKMAKALGLLTSQWGVDDARQSDPAGNVAAVVDETIAERLVLGDLILRARSDD